MKPNLKWPDIKAGAKVAGVNPHELRRRLLRQPAQNDLPPHLANRNAWVDAAAELMLSLPMEYSAELLACHLYDRLVRFPPKRP